MGQRNFITSRSWGANVRGHLEARVFERAASVVCWTCRGDGEPCRWRIDRFVSPMTTAVGMRGRTCGAGLGCNSTGPGFHVGTPIAFVCADSAVSSCRGSCFSAAGGVGERGRSFELAKDGFFVSEKIADEAVGVFLVQRKRCVGSRTENTRSEIVGKGGYVFIIR